MWANLPKRILNIVRTVINFFAWIRNGMSLGENIIPDSSHTNKHVKLQYLKWNHSCRDETTGKNIRNQIDIYYIIYISIIYAHSQTCRISIYRSHRLNDFCKSLDTMFWRWSYRPITTLYFTNISSSVVKAITKHFTCFLMVNYWIRLSN